MANFEDIPQFYFPYDPPTAKVRHVFSTTIDPFFRHTCSGLLLNDHLLQSLTKAVCMLPSVFSNAIFRKVDSGGTGVMTRDAFFKYWIDGDMLRMDAEDKIYIILKKPDSNYLSPDDFIPVLEHIVATHPDLKPLKLAIPTTQARYAETVICRIFHHINRSGNGCLTIDELKRADLVSVMYQVAEQDDIEQIRYFSLKHFIVISRKFREIDRDGDQLINMSDLLTYYDGGALTPAVVRRIFSQAPRKLSCDVERTVINGEVERMMNRQDFVYFLLSEVDKSSRPGIEYWFKCLDLNENGKLTSDEFKYFYEAQTKRMGKNTMQFEGMLCKIFDMVAPENQDYITLLDMKRCKQAGTIFNMLFNSKRYTEYFSNEQVRFRHENPEMTEWDIFAEKEYSKLITARREEQNQASIFSCTSICSPQ